MDPGIGAQRLDAQSVALRQRLAAHRLEQLQRRVGIAVVEVECRLVGIPQRDQLAACRRTSDAAERRARTRDVARIQVLLDGEQRVAVALGADGIHCKAHVGGCSLAVVAVARESLGPIFGRTGDTAQAARFAAAQNNQAQHETQHACL